MRIMILTRAMPWHGAGGGMEQSANDLATRWALLGHDVTVATSASADRKAPDDLPFRLIELPTSYGRFSPRWWTATAGLDLTGVDVVMGVSAAARRLARTSTVPVVLQAHGTTVDEISTKLTSGSIRRLATIPRNIPWLFRDRADYPRYARIIAVSPTVLRGIRVLAGPKVRATVTTIPNGVAARSDLGDSRTRRGLVYVGRLHVEKGVDLLLRALEQVDAPLDVYGDGSHRPQLEGLVDRLGLRERVTFHGRVDQATVHAALRGAELLVMPSRRREGLPLTALEGLDAGTPILLSRNAAAGFGDVLPSGVSVTSTRPALLAEGIRRALRTPPPVTLPEIYTAQASSEQYLEVFDTVVPVGDTGPAHHHPEPDADRSRPMTLIERLVGLRGKPVVGVVARTGMRILGVEIPSTVRIGVNLQLPHGAFGLVVHGSTVIGSGVKLYQGVTIGRSDTFLPPDRTKKGGFVTIEDDVLIGANAVILFRSGSDLVIGKGAVVGAGAVVTSSVPSGEVWAGSPARKVSTRTA